jgi:hypothetical protein
MAICCIPNSGTHVVAELVNNLQFGLKVTQLTKSLIIIQYLGKFKKKKKLKKQATKKKIHFI